MHWGLTAMQLLTATGDGTVDVLSLPDMGRMWALKGHAATCLTFAVDRDNG